jgi:lipid-A-disaccharide synthase
MADRTRRALVVAGEASGDLHGASLIRAARDVDPGLAFFGIGGRLMAEAGCDILFPAEELAVMGLVEVVGRLPAIRRAFAVLRAALQGDRRPDLVVLIDYPGFNLRFAAEARRAGIPVLYYISPKVWAWRRGRARTIARVVDKLAVIFPFEPDIFRGLGLDVEYVGNPLLDEFRPVRDAAGFLLRQGLDPARPTIGLFPGSRRGELKYNLEPILDAAGLLQAEKPGVQFLLAVAPGFSVDEFAGRLAARGLTGKAVQEDIYAVAGACQAALAVSGTVTLQIALAGTPMAILYRLAPLSYAVGRRVVRIPHIGLPNIVAGEEVVREFIQDRATPRNLATEMSRLLDDAAYRQQVKEGLVRVQASMGAPGCSQRVARIASTMSRGDLTQRTMRP